MNVPVRHCRFPYLHPHRTSADGRPFRSASADFDGSNSTRSKPSLRPPIALRCRIGQSGVGHSKRERERVSKSMYFMSRATTTTMKNIQTMIHTQQAWASCRNIQSLIMHVQRRRRGDVLFCICAEIGPTISDVH